MPSRRRFSVRSCLAAATVAVMPWLAACSADDIKDFLHVTGKVAYDSFKNAQDAPGNVPGEAR